MKNQRPNLLVELKKKINPIKSQNRRHFQNIKLRHDALLKQNMDNAEKKRS